LSAQVSPGRDSLSVVALAVLLIGVFVGGGVWVELHGVPHTSVFVGMFAVGMALCQGWQMRSLYKRRMFLPYFVVWIGAETTAIMLVLARYGTIAGLPLWLGIIAAGYAVTFAIFGIPSELKRKPKPAPSDTPRNEDG
jgi:hypothetical protein